MDDESCPQRDACMDYCEYNFMLGPLQLNDLETLL